MPLSTLLIVSIAKALASALFSIREISVTKTPEASTPSLAGA
jgi:hypothetical protein